MCQALATVVEGAQRLLLHRPTEITGRTATYDRQIYAQMNENASNRSPHSTRAIDSGDLYRLAPCPLGWVVAGRERCQRTAKNGSCSFTTIDRNAPADHFVPFIGTHVRSVVAWLRHRSCTRGREKRRFSAVRDWLSAGERRFRACRSTNDDGNDNVVGFGRCAKTGLPEVYKRTGSFVFL
uniref:Uncharacterized protein n=1 Tax=Trichuris muris TaxID=70415 RepID=A0A5S6R2I1_TRIMR